VRQHQVVEAATLLFMRANNSAALTIGNGSGAFGLQMATKPADRVARPCCSKGCHVCERADHNGRDVQVHVKPRATTYAHTLVATDNCTRGLAPAAAVVTVSAVVGSNIRTTKTHYMLEVSDTETVCVNVLSSTDAIEVAATEHEFAQSQLTPRLIDLRQQVVGDQTLLEVAGPLPPNPTDPDYPECTGSLFKLTGLREGLTSLLFSAYGERGRVESAPEEIEVYKVGDGMHACTHAPPAPAVDRVGVDGRGCGCGCECWC
jgi:hypothetical protein